MSILKMPLFLVILCYPNNPRSPDSLAFGSGGSNWIEVVEAFAFSPFSYSHTATRYQLSNSRSQFERNAS